jgi:hypothetical protein
MKKFLLIITILVPFFAMAQDDSDLLDFSSIYYQGTAKSAAMGNAMGAVGSDFSAIAINPAGLGLFRKASFVYTPSFYAISNESNYQGSSNSDRAFRLQNNNIGLTWTQDINDGSLSTVSFAIGINNFQNYALNSYVSGNNANTSLIDAYATEILENGINSSSALENYSPNLIYPLWETYVIDSVGPGICTTFVPAGGLNQEYGLTKRGTSKEFTFASGFNFNEKFFMGVSVGIPYFDRKITKEYKESNLNNGELFRNWSQTENISNSGWGINAKVGAIVYPARWVRLGASVSTPYLYNVTESWNTETHSAFSSGSYSYESPTGTYSYTVTTPFRFNASAALIFGNYGMITGDYEYVNYSKMRASSYDFNYNNLNNFIKDNYKATSNFRIGTEWRWQTLAFRAGYALYGSPFGFGKKEMQTTSYSCGFGYTYHNFTIDMAYVLSQRNNSYDLYSRFTTYPAYYLNSNNEQVVDETKVKETTNINQVVISLKFRLD